MTSPQILVDIAGKYFDNQCEVTLRPYRNEGFTVHHVRYIEDDIERSQYPKGFAGSRDYYFALEDEIKKDRSRFALITNGIHSKLDNYRHGVCRLGLENRIRFCDLALRTVPRTRGVAKK